MEKPRRRAAGRAEGPPNPVRDEPIVAQPAAPVDQAGDPAEYGAETGADPAPPQHRRRQRADRPSATRAENGPGEAARPPEPARERPRPSSTSPRDDRRRGESSMERSLRALVSTRTTQLSPTIAMRAREVAAPSAADLAAADEELVIVRRHYVPPAPLVTAKKTPEPKSPETRSSDGQPPEARGRGVENRRGGRRPRGQ